MLRRHRSSANDAVMGAIASASDPSKAMKYTRCAVIWSKSLKLTKYILNKLLSYSADVLSQVVLVRVGVAVGA